MEAVAELPKMPGSLEHRFYETPESPTVTGIQREKTRDINHMLESALQTDDVREVRKVLAAAITRMLKENSVAEVATKDRAYLEFTAQEADQVLLNLGLEVYPETDQEREGLTDWDTRLNRTQIGAQLVEIRAQLAKALQYIIPVNHNPNRNTTMTRAGQIITRTSRVFAEEAKERWIRRRNEGLENDTHCIHPWKKGITMYVTEEGKKALEAGGMTAKESTEYENGIWGLVLDEHGFGGYFDSKKLSIGEVYEDTEEEGWYGENPGALEPSSIQIPKEHIIRIEALQGNGRMWQNPLRNLDGTEKELDLDDDERVTLLKKS